MKQGSSCVCLHTALPQPHSSNCRQFLHRMLPLGPQEPQAFGPTNVPTSQSLHVSQIRREQSWQRAFSPSGRTFNGALAEISGAGAYRVHSSHRSVCSTPLQRRETQARRRATDSSARRHALSCSTRQTSSLPWCPCSRRVTSPVLGETTSRHVSTRQACANARALYVPF